MARAERKLGAEPTIEGVLSLLKTMFEGGAEDPAVQKAALLSLQGFPTGAAEEMVPEQSEGPEDLLLKRERLGYLHQAIQALPYLMTVILLAGVIGTAIPPRASGVPYVKER